MSYQKTRGISVKLSIIIVSWNLRDYVLNCLRSIVENPSGNQFEVIVVDNASTDGTVKTVRNNFPNLTIIANSENRGFAAANNQAISIARGEYILFLNPDTVVQPNSLDVLVKFMDDNREVGICGPKLLNKDETTQPSTRRFPIFCAALHRHTIFRATRIFQKQYRSYMMSDFAYDRQADVDQVAGAALMTRRSIVDELGAFDERFFMYYEEVDFCYRVKNDGWRIVFTPAVSIIYFGNRSAVQIPVENQTMFLKSMLNFFRKNRGIYVTGLFNIIFKPALLLHHIELIVSGLIIYAVATLLFDRKRRNRALMKVNISITWLRKYSLQTLLKT